MSLGTRFSAGGGLKGFDNQHVSELTPLWLRRM